MRHLFVSLLFLFTYPILAQESPENWAMGRLICMTQNSYRIEIEAIGATDTVLIFPEIEDGIVWEVGDEKTKTLEVSRQNTSLSFVIYALGGAFYGDSLILTPVSECDSQETNLNRGAIAPVPQGTMRIIWVSD